MANKELIGASTIPLLLTVLQSGEYYGYELIKKAASLSGGKLKWSEAMLYPVLHRLERDGSIGARWVIMENGRKRKYYSITAQGKSLLAEKRADWLTMIDLFTHVWDLKPTQR